MSAPDHIVWERRKRLARYLAGKPRAVCSYTWQREPDTLDAYYDASWAGCKDSRNSTSGGTLMWGQACLKSYSKT